MAQQFLKGIAHLKLNGVPYANSVEGGFTITIKPDEFEVIRSSDGSILHSSKPAVSKIAGKLLVTQGFNVTPLFTATNVGITVVTQIGTFGLRNAVFTGSGEIDTSSGEIDVEFSGIGFQS